MTLQLLAVNLPKCESPSYVLISAKVSANTIFWHCEPVSARLPLRPGSMISHFCLKSLCLGCSEASVQRHHAWLWESWQTHFLCLNDFPVNGQLVFCFTAKRSHILSRKWYHPTIITSSPFSCFIFLPSPHTLHVNYLSCILSLRKFCIVRHFVSCSISGPYNNLGHLNSFII